MSNPNKMSPENRHLFIDDFLKQKGLHRDPKKLTEFQLIARQAIGEFDSIWKGTILPLLKALKSPSDYKSDGTQKLLVDAFKARFNKWDKDSLVYLISVMHAEEMEKQASQLAEQGILGEYMDKPI